MARIKMGLPPDWADTDKWLTAPIPAVVADLDPTVGFTPKWPDIPVLDSYKHPPPPQFWSKFPAAPLNENTWSPIDVSALTDILKPVIHLMSPSQAARARTAVAELKYGVDALQDRDLCALRAAHSGSVYRYGRIFTENVATWIAAGYVKGPFIAPPHKNFRANQMLAVPQKGKIRVIMNLSFPQGASFNDNVKDHMMEAVTMTTARQFGFAIVEAGPGARMWKYDLKDAYKNMPAKPSDTHLQGFTWLGRFFVEGQQCFGARTAVAAYDRLGNTLLTIAAINADVPTSKLHRCLDDVPIVAPAQAAWGARLAEEYKLVCSAVGAQLAPNCPNNDKAFENSTVGTVLGVRFDSNTMTWSWSADKVQAALAATSKAANGALLNLHDMQGLMGILNDFAQSCPFLKAFRVPLNAFLAGFGSDESVEKRLTGQAAKDLRVWAAAIQRSATAMPIPHRPEEIPLQCVHFVTDAAGAKFCRINGRHVPVEADGGRGAAAIGIRDDGSIWFFNAVRWSQFLLTKATDGAGKAYGCKTATLEAI